MEAELTFIKLFLHFCKEEKVARKMKGIFKFIIMELMIPQNQKSKEENDIYLLNFL